MHTVKRKWEWKYSFTHSLPQHEMEMIGQLHMSTDLLQGKQMSLPIE